MVSVYLN